MTTGFTLGKEERLKSNLAIQELLKNGRTVSGFPLKIYWNIQEDQQQKFPARVAFAVPKRKIKRAVDRNLVKRRLRESYRQNKNIIYSPLNDRGVKIFMIILFLSDELISFETLETRTIELLRKLANNFPK